MDIPESFGSWLSSHRGRDSLVGELADIATGDPSFPWGTASEVRNYLAEISADDGWFDALDLAIKDWSGR